MASIPSTIYEKLPDFKIIGVPSGNIISISMLNHTVNYPFVRSFNFSPKEDCSEGIILVNLRMD